MKPPVLERSEPLTRVRPDALASGGPFKLLLGGRETRIPGFLNVDCVDIPSVDIVADITKLPMIKDGSVLEIYSSHCLEHQPHTQTLDTLKEWRRVLAKGGSCFISVPDMDFVFKAYQKFGMTEFLVHLIWGDQGYDMAYHYVGFTYARLAALLIKAGFSDVGKRRFMPYGIGDCSTLVDTLEHQPISLTVEAFA